MRMRLHATGIPKGLQHEIIGRITTGSADTDQDSVLFWSKENQPESLEGINAVLTHQRSLKWQLDIPWVYSLTGLDYLTDGDIVHIRPNGFVRTLYRKNSEHNFLLLTEQCNSYCLMCSQ